MVVFGRKERLEGNVGAGQVVEAGGGDEFVAQTPHARALAVHQEQIACQHVFGCNVHTRSYHFVEGARCKLACREERAQVDRAVRREAGIRLTVQVNGDARDDEQVGIRREQATFDAAVRAHHDAAGHRQRLVEPGMVHDAAICFDV